MATKGGLIAGMLGGLSTWTFLVLCAWLSNRGLWLSEHLLRGAVPVILAFLLHMTISLAWGFAFGLVAYGLSGPQLFVAGIGWGLVSGVVALVLGLPMVGLGEASGRNMAGLVLFEHGLFGVGLGVAMPSHVRSGRPRRSVSHAGRPSFS